MVLPNGVSYVASGSSNSIWNAGNIVAVDPVNIFQKGRMTFAVNVKVLPTAGPRLVFRSFLSDPLSYCEATDALTVRQFAYNW